MHGEEIRRAWLAAEGPHVPLPLAAAWAFHEAHDALPAAMPRLEYEDALDLIAAALSRLVALYTIDERTQEPVPARFNLATGRFRGGATVYERKYGGRTMSSLVVQREQLPAALQVIKATGIPFHFEPPARATRSMTTAHSTPNGR